MHHLKRLRTVSLLTCLVGLAPVRGGQAAPSPPGFRDWSQYDKVYGLYEKFYGLPGDQRSHFQFRLRASANSKSIDLGRATLVIKAPGGDRQFGFSADGVMQFPRDQELFASNPPILTSLSASEHLTFRPEVYVADFHGTSFGTDTLMAWIAQANACVRAYAGVFALLAPHVTAVEVSFASPSAVIRVSSAAGEAVIKADQAGIATVDTYATTYPKDARFELSEPPREIRPVIPASVEFHAKSDE